MPTILVAEDSADARRPLVRLLKGEGYDVLTAGNALETLSIAQREHPDLILLDVGMPRLDGVKLSQLLRAHPRMARTPIVIMSGLEQERAPIALHYDAWLRKPFELTALSAIVATMAA